MQSSSFSSLSDICFRGHFCSQAHQDWALNNLLLSCDLFSISGAESSGNLDAISKDLLPRQEARLKAGLEMAVKHKDKLLEFDRTR